MTDETKTPDEEPKDETPQDADKSSESETSTEESGSSEKPADDAGKADSSKWNPVAKADDDPLPDLVERTPEYVEEEAQRADFVIRWAIVLLAMMLGFTKPDETQTAILVHAKSGEYMQANGFLPPGKDVLSYTAEGQEWIQLSWLFDHMSAAVTGMLGDVGFTVLSALFAAIAFGYAVHTAIPKLSTWWTTICVGIALLACYPRFVATPEVITLAFSAITVAWLYRWQSSESAGFPWKIPVLFVIWANTDPYMWIGVFLIVLYALGHAVDKIFRRPGWTLPGKSNQVWLLLGLCIVAALCNPFIHESLMQPLRTYQVEYPAMRTEIPLRESRIASVTEWALQPYGLLKPEVWMAGHKRIIAGGVILLLAIGAFIVNLKNQDTGYFFMLLGLIVLTVFASHELPVAALVAAVLAGLNGQDWYRHNFNTAYTTDTGSFVFLQGGRAITVIALFALAFLGITGRLTGPNGVRIGAGFDANLKATLSGMEKAIAETDDDVRLFNFKRSQGDMLIWLNRKSFIDSRTGLFGTGDDSIAATHRATRGALRSDRINLGTGDKKLVDKTVKDYEIDLVAPRLYSSPDYVTYFDLFRSPDWTPKSLECSIALFEKAVPGKEPRGVSFRKQGLQTNLRESPTRLDWAREPGFYDAYVVPKTLRREESQLAMHYQNHLGDMPRTTNDPVMPLPQSLAELLGACYLTIRTANDALAIDGNDDRAYYALGVAYQKLEQLEQSITQQSAGGIIPALRDLRLKQAIAAYRQSLRANPTQEDVCFKLYDLYFKSGKRELALQMITQGLDILDTGEERDAKMEEGIDTLSKVRNNLREGVETVVKQVQEIRAQRLAQMQASGQEIPPATRNAELLEYCARCMSPQTGGLTLHAQATIEEDMAAVQGSPPAMLVYGRLLLDNGDFEEADRLFRELEALAEENPALTEQLDWQLDASVIALIGGDSKRAASLLEKRFAVLNKAVDEPSMDSSMLQALPILSGPDMWPSSQLDVLNGVLVSVPNNVAEIRFRMALAFLESGRTNAGGDLLRTLIEETPAAPVIPLARIYYKLVTDKEVRHTTDQSFLPLDLDAADKEEAAASTQEKTEPKSGDDKPEGGEPKQPGDAGAVDKPKADAGEEKEPDGDQ